jgi:quinol monooxygenase YgiN
MSVIVTIRFAGDPARFENVANANRDRLLRVVEEAKRRGVIHHRFVGGQGEFMVIDEWPSAAAFQEFFAATQEVQKLMADAGVTAEPEVAFWQPMDTADQI